MIVVPHRPGRRLAIALSLAFCVLLSTLAGAYFGFTQGFDAQREELNSRSELDAMLQAVSIENEELRRRLALAEAASAKVGRRLEFKQKPRTENRKLGLEPKA